MSTLPELALRVSVLKALADRVAKADTQTRTEIKAAMETVGADRVTAKLPDGTPVAAVILAGADSAPTAYVRDEAAFLGWVAEHHPDEIVRRVRDSFKAKVLDDAAKTGEAIPGVELAEKTPYVSRRFKPGGRAAIAAAHSSGVLPLADLLALPAGDEDS